MLYHPDLDASLAGYLRAADPEALWEEAGLAMPGGRGSVRHLLLQDRPYLLKLERRGGLLGKLLPEGFLTKSPFLEEWELSLILSREGLTPPILARWFVASGPWVRIFSLLEPLPRAASLVSVWKAGGLTPELLRAAGACIGALHRRGIWHGDLNAGNLLSLPEGRVVAIDWRRSRVMDPLPGKVRRANLLRLARSLHKVHHLHRLPWPERTFESLAGGYAEGYGEREPWLGRFPKDADQRHLWRRLLWPSSRR